MDQDKPVQASEVSQFALLRQRRFAPYFVAQLLGAFNDNVYKNALIALVAFNVINAGASDDGMLINLAAGLFILPFFLFSALSGQIADKYEKARLIQYVKMAEIIIMICGVTALFLQSLPLLLAVLFLMGTQSAFFGPVKYGILPQHLHETELTAGNGLVELGTFLAILAGTIVGTQLMSSPGGVWALSSVLILVAVGGYLASRQIPPAPACAPDLQIRFNVLAETTRLIRHTAAQRVIFQSILAISWFWLLGASYLAQFPVYARDVLGGSVDVFTALLATFSIGIALGSVLCEKLSHGRVEIGLVPFGALGLTIFGLDLVFATPDAPLGVDLSLMAFLQASEAWRVLFDVAFIGLFGGFYIVPLYALIQQFSDSETLSRAMACNNILNALFMVLSAVFALFMLAMGASIAQLFLALSVLNALVALYIFKQVPEFFMRFLIWLLVHTLYRVRKQGMHHIPDSGAVIVVANHVSFVDALVLGGCIRRPVRFVMYYKIYQLPVMNFIFRTARAIPIAGRSENPALYEAAFAQMHEALNNGDVLCIFPEGQITADGEMNEFRPGILRILEHTPVPVVPVALQGLWGSLFSRKGGPAFFKLPRRMFARIGLNAGPALPAVSVTLDVLREQIHDLRGARR